MTYHKISAGQVYESCQPVRSESVYHPGSRHVRLKVVGYTNRRKVWVATLTEDGREIRARWLEASQLHESGTTAAGLPRRTGYRLVQETETDA
jgi:Mn-dependent DtxR family transcriptional regulator